VYISFPGYIIQRAGSITAAANLIKLLNHPIVY